jgi:hypothetical protein
VTGYEWALQEGIWIYEPIGWTNDGKSLDDPISYDEYRERVLNSVIGPVPSVGGASIVG